MIASQKIGKNFMGALYYNMKKINHPDPAQRAELLAGNFASVEKKLIQTEVEVVRELRPNLSRYVYHTSLNFSEKELPSLNNEKLAAIAQDYLQALGYGNNQYLIFRHYDAGHPHLHILANRISFDGSVVSDSNNYKKSEAVVRELEYKYNLLHVLESTFRVAEQGNAISVERGNQVAQRAPNKNEIEMAVRTGKPSDKMALQAKLNRLIRQGISIQEFIKQGERQGINFLFNQASTGKITGITYFYNDFKAKGQALGNRFKWAELINKIAYEQNGDGVAISRANDRTRAKYGLQQSIQSEEPYRGRNDVKPAFTDAAEFNELNGISSENSAGSIRDTATYKQDGSDDNNSGQIPETASDNSAINRDMPAHLRDIGSNTIQIADDVDDALKRRKRRGR